MPAIRQPRMRSCRRTKSGDTGGFADSAAIPFVLLNLFGSNTFERSICFIDAPRLIECQAKKLKGDEVIRDGSKHTPCDDLHLGHIACLVKTGQILDKRGDHVAPWQCM